MASIDSMGTVKTEPSTATAEQTKSKANAVASISEESDQLFSLENRERLQMKLQGRPRNLSNNNAANNIKARVKTDLGNPTPTTSIDQTSPNPLNGKSNSRPGIREFLPDSDLVDTILQREITIDPSIIDSKLKKIRNAKREIINIKLSEIRRKSDKGNLLRLPEIKRLKYELYNCSRLQEDQLSLYTDAVANTVLQIETIKIPPSGKNSVKDIRP